MWGAGAAKLSRSEKAELQKKTADAAQDPFASRKLPGSDRDDEWDVRDAGWEEYGPHRQAEEWLAAADSDGDKTLSADEFHAGALARDPALTHEELELMFYNFDEDNDKKITLRELTLHMDEFEGNQSEADFQHADKNGDGKVDAQEFVAWYADAKSLLAPEKTRARFKDVDANEDGGISLAEAKEHWEVFHHEDGEKAKRRPRGKFLINRNKVTHPANRKTLKP